MGKREGNAAFILCLVGEVAGYVTDVTLPADARPSVK
jgi:hypothetical protein